MAMIKKVQKLKRNSQPKRKSLEKSRKVELPDEISRPIQNINQLGIVIYGNTGIGKSSFCKHFGKPFYFRFEPSSQWLETYQSAVINKWGYALDLVSAAEANLKGYTTMVIDTAGPCYDRCMEHICEGLNISHPSRAKDYGASWKDIQKEYHKFHARLAALNAGLIIVAHDTVEEIETFDEGKKTMIVPHFSGWCMDFYKRWVDLIGYYFYFGSERFLLIRGTNKVMAKCNSEDHFLTRNKKRIVCIPMGNSSQEAYNNFMKAFRNEQEEDYAEILQKSGLTYVKPKKLKKTLLKSTK